jgi:integrase
MANEYPGLRKKGEHYYFETSTTPRRTIALGKNWGAVMAQYNRLRAAERRTRSTTCETVREMVQAYLDHLDAGGNGMAGEPLAPSTLEVYHAWAQHLFDTMGDVDPRVVTQKDIDRYMYACKRTSFDHERSVLSGAYKHAMRTQDDIVFNPCLGVRSEKKPARRTVLLKDAQLLAMRDALNPMLRCGLDLAYMLGLRPCDLCTLKKSDFVADGNVATQKTGQVQGYQMTEELAEVLAEAKRLQGARITDYVLTNGQGEPFTVPNIQYHWRAAKVKAGLANADIQFRDLRPKAATDRDLEADDDGASAQRFLGHKSRATTRIYLRDRKPNVVIPMDRKKAKLT